MEITTLYDELHRISENKPDLLQIVKIKNRL